MPTAWRLTKTRHLADAFTGEGARLYGGRWNSPGLRAVYVSETLALAALEVLVHLADTGPLAAYSYVRVEFDDALVERLLPDELPSGWADSPAPAEVVAMGDRWLREARSAVLQVPSAVIPAESNFVLNPRHRDFGRIDVGSPGPLRFDSRLRRP